ncbi:putative uncharacterized protein DDB_G0277255 isoform X2 [Sitodiplosis mosellana]|uniref:putative uncharacterized protein DDB_G0277255 isoform X2 n=1 Tax=Sitodiplosis mosellana TaxID=263140 RepID=UPI002443AF6F|nr:putative uncharacterized protein DDB_G0277255 isoform X2 [Sitodiplosis mosellana]
MRCIVVFFFTLQCIICSAIVHQSAYNPVFEYDVPVASQPIVYTAPTVQTGPYYGSYSVHTTPAVSHTYSQTQTHPVAYVKPSGQYYAPSAPTSRVEHSRLIVPQTNRIYRYQSTNQQYAYPVQRSGTQFRNQSPGQNFQNFLRGERPTNQQYNENKYNGYANSMPYANNGEQVKLRRYQIYRPGIKKEFYDVEERVIVRPVGSALIEFDPPSKKQDITEGRPNTRNYASNHNQYNFQGLRTNGRSDDASNQNGQFYSTSVSDCGYGYDDQSPVYEYSPPATSFDSPKTQYHPTTFAPTATTEPTTNNYPTTGYPPTVPSQTYLPPFSTDQSFTSSSSSEYTPSTAYSSTPGQYTPTSTSTASNSDSSTTAKQSDIYISSTTPVSVTIVDKNDNSNQNQTTPQEPYILYADQRQSNENIPIDQFQNEIPPRGDISQYRAEQPDQFYHELPRSRITNEPNRPIVYSRSHGEPTFYREDVDEDVKYLDSTNDQNRTSHESNQQARLIQLYTDNGGVSEVGQTETESEAGSRYSDQGKRNSQYQDVGNVRARVVSVTPPPASFLPTETVNRRRIVVSKPVTVTTVQEVVGSDSSKNNTQSSDYEGDFDNSNGRYQSNFEDGSEYNANYRNEDKINQNSYPAFSGNYENVDSRRDANSNKFDSGPHKKGANYKDRANTSASTGVYISTTPSTASQRIIYVQPVSQDFAQQRAVTPKKP